MVHVAGIIKFLIGSLFFYFTYYHENSLSDFKIFNIKKLLMFSFMYVLTLSLYGYFTMYHSTYMLISTIFVSIYFCIEVKKIKNPSFILMFSVLSNLFIEFLYLMSYKTICILDSLFKLIGVNLNISVTTTMVLILYFTTLLIVYRIKFLKTRDVKNISTCNQISILFSVCLLMVMYVKHQIKAVPKNVEFYNTLWIILLSVMPIYLGFYIVLKNWSRLKNMDKNHTIEGLLEYMVQIPRYCATLNIQPCSGTYEMERIDFKRKLAKLNINHGFKGYSQLVLCLTAIKHFEHELLHFESIFARVACFTKDNPESVYENISNIIKKTWLLEEPETLKHGFKAVDNIESKPPTVEEFLTHMAKAA